MTLPPRRFRKYSCFHPVLDLIIVCGRRVSHVHHEGLVSMYLYQIRNRVKREVWTSLLYRTVLPVINGIWVLLHTTTSTPSRPRKKNWNRTLLTHKQKHRPQSLFPDAPVRQHQLSSVSHTTRYFCRRIPVYFQQHSPSSLLPRAVCHKTLVLTRAGWTQPDLRRNNDPWHPQNHRMSIIFEISTSLQKDKCWRTRTTQKSMCWQVFWKYRKMRPSTLRSRNPLPQELF